MPKDDLRVLIKDLESDMQESASDLDFERAALIRDEIVVLNGVLKNKH
jgi:excinuclease ABC subunit B